MVSAKADAAASLGNKVFMWAFLQMEVAKQTSQR